MPDQGALVYKSSQPRRVGAPVFVGGDHRSGTTLVDLVLDAHPAMVVGPELDFLLPPDLGAHLLACCDLELAGDPSVAGPGVRTADPRWQLGIQLVRQCHRFGIDAATLRALVLEQLAGGAALVDFTERAALVDALGQTRRRAAGARRWGIKIQRDIVDAVRFAEFWPDATFVHVVRDGRDVAASHLLSGHPWAYTTVAEAAAGWMAVVTRVPRAELARRLFELRYEDLVAEPEPVLRDLVAFLDLPWDDAVLRHDCLPHDLARHPYDHPSVDAATRGIETTPTGRYRRDLTVEEVAEFEALASDVLGTWGYRAASPAAASGRAR